MSAFSIEVVLIAVAGLVVAIGVAVMAVGGTVRLLRANRGGLAALALGVLLAWLPLSVAAAFFLSMFGSAHVAAMHAHQAGAGVDASSWIRAAGLGYVAIGALLMWVLSRLGRRAGPAA